MKATSARKVLGEEERRADLWIDVVSGNEMLRAGFPGGVEPLGIDAHHRRFPGQRAHHAAGTSPRLQRQLSGKQAGLVNDRKWPN